jgi:hypothetical protein
VRQKNATATTYYGDGSNITGIEYIFQYLLDIPRVLDCNVVWNYNTFWMGTL